MSKVPVLEVLRLTPKEFRKLYEYSSSSPTGTTIGKRWKRLNGVFDQDFIASGGKPRWMIGEYVCSPDPTKVRIKWYKPLITMRAAT